MFLSFGQKRLKPLLLIFCLLGVLLSSCCFDTKKNYRIALQATWKKERAAGLDRNIPAFSYDLLQAIALAQNVHFEITIDDPIDLSAGLKNGLYDAILIPIDGQLFFSKSWNLSDSYLKTGLALITSIESNELSTENWEGKILSIPNDIVFNVENSPYRQASIHSYQDVEQAIEDVANGFIDGAILDYFIAVNYCQTVYENQILLHLPLVKENGAYLAVRKKQHADLLHLFNKGLAQVKETGYYDVLKRKWQIPS